MSENMDPEMQIRADYMNAILNDPAKKKVLLQLINKEKDVFSAYSTSMKSHPTTPINRIRKKVQCESPTALFRRRALEKMNQDNSDSSSERGETTQAHPPRPQVPFGELLKGVTAFVEVLRDGNDRSMGIKAIMRCMGANIKEEFTRDVTHVVFKDGSFITYQRAKLLKIHLVSVLWIDAVKKNGYRVSEKKYPAFGSQVCDANVSVLCSQLQKDYEDVISDEKRRSLTLISNSQVESSKDRRKTVMPRSKSPDLTSDDSDCGIVDGYSSKHLKMLKTIPSISDDLSAVSNPNIPSSFESAKSNESISLLSKGNRKTINVLTDMILTPNINAGPKRLTTASLDTSDLIDSEESPGKGRSGTSSLATNDSFHSIHNEALQNKENASDGEVSIKSVPETDKRTSTASDASKKSELLGFVSSRSTKKDRRSTMSSVRISSASSKTRSDLGEIQEERAGSIMSSLRISEASTNSGLESVPPTKSTKNQETMSSLRISETSTDVGAIKKKPLLLPIRRSQRKSIASRTSTDSGLNKTTSSESQDSGEKARRKTARKTLNFPVNKPISSKKRKETPPESEESSSDSSPVKIPRTPKTRKLYNQEDALNLLSKDIIREEPKQIAKKIPEDETFVNPNNIALVSLLAKKKRIVESSSSSESEEEPLATYVSPKKQKKRKKTTPNVLYDSEQDEQKDLLSYFNKIKENPSPRRSPRLSLAQPLDSPITPSNRRSTMDFQKVATMSQSRKVKVARSIVCTKLHRPESQYFEGVVNKLGNFFVENTVTDKTTHLVAGESKRTINMLRAITRGCWILKYEWVEKSEQAGKWLPEEDFEMTDFSPAVQQCRLERQAFGPRFSMDLFLNCGDIYVASTTTPSCRELKELITKCEGKVTSAYRYATIAVGENVKRENVTSVTEMWILDSIRDNELKPMRRYRIKSIEPQSPHF